MISGLAERGDVFTLDDGTSDASVTIGSEQITPWALANGGGIEVSKVMRTASTL